MKTMKFVKKRLFLGNLLSQPKSDENGATPAPNQPKVCFNFRQSGKSLVRGHGLSHLQMPISQTEKLMQYELELNPLSQVTFKKIWRYKYYSTRNERYDYLLVAYASDGNLYYHNIFFADVNFHDTEIALNSQPVALNFIADGFDVLGFSSPQDDFLVWHCDDDPYTLADAPKFAAICLHKQRLFVIDSQKDNLVRFSAKTDPTLWTTADDEEDGGGTIEMNDYKGELKNLLSMGDYVFVFRDFGISKITSHSSSSVYYASNVYSSSHKIYPLTACVCDDKIFFLQEDGLYEFNGSSVKKVPIKIFETLNKTYQTAANTCFYNGRLFVACKLNFADEEAIGCEEGEHKNNCLVEFDPKTSSCSVTRGVDVCCMVAVRDLFVDKLIVLQNSSSYVWQLNDTGKVHQTVLKGKWESDKIDLGNPHCTKILKEINLKCLCSCQIIVTSSRGKKVFNLYAKEKSSKLVCNLAGEEFYLSVSSQEEEVDIREVEMIFSEKD